MSDSLDFSILALDTPKTFNINTNKLICPSRFTKDYEEYWESNYFMGLKGYLSKNQKKILNEILGKWPNLDYNDVNIIAGMRSGKTTVLAGPLFTWFLHHLLSFDPQEKSPQSYYGLRNSDIIYLVCVACSKEQGTKTIFSSFKQVLETSPFWISYKGWMENLELSHKKIKFFDQESKSIIDRIVRRGDLYSFNDNRYAFKMHNVVVEVQSTNSASAAGRTSLLVGFDETSRLNRSGSSLYEASQDQSAEAIVETMRNSLATLGKKSLFLSITSPQHDDDYGMELFNRSGKFLFGENSGDEFISFVQEKEDRNERILGVHMSTYDILNLEEAESIEDPVIRERLVDMRGFLESKKYENPDTFRRDFEAKPSRANDRYFQNPDRYIENLDIKRKNLFEISEYHEVYESYSGNQNANLYVTGLNLHSLRRNVVQEYPWFCHGDGGVRRNSFVLVGGYAKPIVDFGHPLMSFENAKDFQAVIEFILEWVPGTKTLQGTTQRENFSVHFQNVENVIDYLISMINFQAVTFDNWAGSLGFVEKMFAKGINAYTFQLKLDHWDSFKKAIYSDKKLIDMYDDRINGYSRSFDQLKRAVQKGKNIDFLAPLDRNDKSHGDVLVGMCGFYAHVADFAIQKNMGMNYHNLRPVGGKVGSGISGGYGSGFIRDGALKPVTTHYTGSQRPTIGSWKSGKRGL